MRVIGIGEEGRMSFPSAPHKFVLDILCKVEMKNKNIAQSNFDSLEYYFMAVVMCISTIL